MIPDFSEVHLFNMVKNMPSREHGYIKEKKYFFHCMTRLMKRQYNLFQQAYLLYVSLLGNCSIQWGLCALYWQTEIEHE